MAYFGGRNRGRNSESGDSVKASLEQPSWWSIELRLAGELEGTLEDKAAELFEIGCQGTVLHEPDRVMSYLTGSDEAVKEFERQCGQLGWEVVTEPMTVTDEDWAARCAEHWEPVEAGAFRVTPISGEAELPDPWDGQTLYVTPGTGFGTGHHPTTRMLLQLIGEEPLKSVLETGQSDETLALDLGTGSGILAIALAAITPGFVDAVDNDSLALENAELNIHRHRFDSRIRLHLGTLADTKKNYPVIVANLYAEILTELEEELCSRMQSGGFLALPGILVEKCPQVLEQFSAPVWELQEHRQEENWSALLFRKI